MSYFIKVRFNQLGCCYDLAQYTNQTFSVPADIVTLNQQPKETLYFFSIITSLLSARDAWSWFQIAKPTNTSLSNCREKQDIIYKHKVPPLPDLFFIFFPSSNLNYLLWDEMDLNSKCITKSLTKKCYNQPSSTTKQQQGLYNWWHVNNKLYLCIATPQIYMIYPTE